MADDARRGGPAELHLRLEQERTRVLRHAQAILPRVDRTDPAKAARLRFLERETAPQGAEPVQLEAALEACGRFECELTDAEALLLESELRQRRWTLAKDGRWRPWVGWLRFTVLLGAAYLLFIKLPEKLVRLASARSTACLDATKASGAGNPADCRRDWLLVYPRLFPAQAHEVRRQQEHVLRRIAALEIELATTRDPSAPRRDAAARQYLRAGDDATLPASHGAFEVAAREANPGQGGDVLEAAVMAADVDRIREIAAVPDETSIAPYSSNQLRGAWLCLLGDRPAGLAQLTRANEQYRRWAGAKVEGWHEAELAVLACGGEPAATLGNGVLSSTASREWLSLRLSDPKWQIGRRRRWFDGLQGQALGADEKYRALALALHERTHAPAELLKLLCPLGERELRLDVDRVASPWTALGPTASEPRWFEQAAEGFYVAALEVERTQLDPESDYGYARFLETSREPLPAAFREAAFALYLQASLGSSRRADEKTARAFARRAIEVAPRNAHLAAAALLAAHDPAAAKRVLRDSLEQSSVKPALNQDPANRARALTLLALAQAAEGRYAEALGDAERARKLAPNQPAPRWLVAALSLRTGKRGLIEPLGKPFPPSTEVWNVQSPLDWYALALAPAAERSERRAKLERAFDIPWEVIPAVMYVIGRAAEGNDVEAWLDYYYAVHRLAPDRRMMLARAEAARWRGDRDAERRWNERAKRLMRLVKDHGTDVLANLVRF